MKGTSVPQFISNALRSLQSRGELIFSSILHGSSPALLMKLLLSVGAGSGGLMQTVENSVKACLPSVFSALFFLVSWNYLTLV